MQAIDVEYVRSNLRHTLGGINKSTSFKKNSSLDSNYTQSSSFDLRELDENLDDDNQIGKMEKTPLNSAVVSWKSPSHANEDRSIQYRGRRFSCFAVMDGHGGDLASEFVKNNLVDIIEEQSDITKRSLRHATHELERRFNVIASRMEDFSGACFVALVIVEDGSRKRFVINCGDCRIAGLERKELRPSKRDYNALSTDHKASCPLEIKRIMAAGGKIIMGRVSGVLAPSRSIGDLDMKMPGMEGWVIADPEIIEDVLCPDSTYVIATDGVWDVMSNRDVLQLADSAWLDNQVAHDGSIGCFCACEAIAQESVSRGSRDDITCIVVRTGEWE